MSKSIDEIAKDLGLANYTFSEIFEMCYSNQDVIDKLSKIGICTKVDKIRENLELAGKRCSLYVGLMNILEDGINKVKHDIKLNVGDTYADEKRLNVLQTHRNVYETMGFLTLLQMDALTTTICLFQANNDTERIMLSKHAYTIIYEAKQNDLFKKVSAEMQKYPESLVDKEELHSFWREIKSVIKKTIDIKEAEEFRNNLDAHKNKSFSTQVALYKKCDWAQGVLNLSVLSMIVDKIQICLDIIHYNLRKLYDQYYAFLKERVKQYEDIMKQLQEYSDIRNDNTQAGFEKEAN